MKIEIQKAEAFEIDRTKQYLVTFEARDDVSLDDAQRIKASILDVFTNLGVKCDAVITIGGRIVLTEMEDGNVSDKA